jgi:hypothetical protein
MKTYITKLRLGGQETGKTPTDPFCETANRSVSDVITDYFNGNLNYNWNDLTNQEVCERFIQQVLATVCVGFRAQPVETDPDYTEQPPITPDYFFSDDDLLPF